MQVCRLRDDCNPWAFITSAASLKEGQRRTNVQREAAAKHKYKTAHLEHIVTEYYIMLVIILIPIAARTNEETTSSSSQGKSKKIFCSVNSVPVLRDRSYVS